MLVVCFSKPGDYSAVNKMEVISELIIKGWETVFQCIPSHCGIPGNDMVDTPAKDALNLPSPEERQFQKLQERVHL